MKSINEETYGCLKNNARGLCFGRSRPHPLFKCAINKYNHLFVLREDRQKPTRPIELNK